MEIENAFVQDLERFGKEMMFCNSSGKVSDFCLENCKHILKLM